MSKKGAYRTELQKQSDPYAYFLQNMQRKERGRSVHIDGPLPCSMPFLHPQIEMLSYTLTEKQRTYVIIREDKAFRYPDADLDLLDRGCAYPADPKALPDLIYCDHDHMRGKVRHTPFLKPGFSPHTLLNANYIGGYFAISDKLFQEIASELAGCEFPEAGDLIYALLLLAMERTDRIAHVPETLFYYRDARPEDEIYASFVNRTYPESFMTLREGVLKRMGLVPGNYTLSVIIPSKDHAGMLIRCLNSVREALASWPKDDWEILIIDNGSGTEDKEAVEAFVQDKENIRYIYKQEAFNFAGMCHNGAQAAEKELLLFLNDDVELAGEGCLDRLCMYAMSPLAGAVGTKLLFPDGKSIQHVGITNQLCGPTHKLSHYPDGKIYYFGANRLPRNVLAVTGACLMVEREKYFHVQGFHDKMTVSYNDVDLCVNLYEKGYFNVVLNENGILHHESLSRGSDTDNDEKFERLFREREIFYRRHAWLRTEPDPFYHPDLIQDTLDFRVNVAADYELRGRESEVEIFECPSVKTSERLQFCIEKTEWERELLPGGDSLLTVTGWSVFLKHEELLYDRYLVLLGEEDAGRGLKISLMSVYRKDVAEVFHGHRHAKLAGFAAKIPSAFLGAGKRYRMAILYVHRITHKSTLTVGAYYEP
ncbi:MAG: glycosyltransferase [Lachnospiraceae bacterium]|nr:glycosyltransferase [Lachnospiraceae bacterium]